MSYGQEILGGYFLLACPAKTGTTQFTANSVHLTLNISTDFICSILDCFRFICILPKKTQLSLTNRATRSWVSQGHQTWYHSIC